MGIKHIYRGIFFTSLSALMLELSLTRIFSVMLYYHFSFMMISLALFGLGVSGACIYIFKEKFPREQVQKQLATFSVVFSITILISFLILSNLRIIPLLTKSTLLMLPVVYIICAIPFFFAGLCISLSLSHLTENVSKLYFSDLLGASSGCLLVILFMHFLDGPTAVIGISFLAALAAFFFAKSYSKVSKDSYVPKKYLAATIILLIVFGGLTIYNTKYKIIKMKYIKGSPTKSFLYEKWNSFSRVAVYPVAPYERNISTEGLSSQYRGPVVDQLYMDIDAGASTWINKFDGDLTKVEHLKYDITSLGYHLKTNPKVLIIGPGGGIDILSALSFGSKDITGVEYNPLIVDIVKNRLKEFTGGLYSRPEVNIITDEGRSYVRSSTGKFDIIQLSFVDTTAAASAGAYVLAESPLYTTEAFIDYLNRLDREGVLMLTRWIYKPPRETLRLISLSLAALKALNIKNPGDNIAVIKHSHLPAAIFILKKSAFTLNEIHKLEDVSKKLKFEIVYTPLTRKNKTFAGLIKSDNPELFYKTYPFDISPSTDDRPFFFHVIRIKDFLKTFNIKEGNIWDSDAILALVSVFSIALFLVILFILLPLVVFKKETLKETGCSKIKYLLYFACLGIGFMLIEISFIYKFVLFLGHPIFALSVVLFSLLFFCGVGSYLTNKFKENTLNMSLKKILFSIVLLVILYVFVLSVIFYHFIILPRYIKIVLSIFLLFPLSLLMGMPFPIGIKLVNRKWHDMIPWIWGVNTGTSVLGSILALILAMSFGFNTTLLIGTALYFVAILLRPS
jgi:hypothetical protein